MEEMTIKCLDKSYSTTQLLVVDNQSSKHEVKTKVESNDRLSTCKEEGGLRLNGYYKRSLLDKPLLTVITVVFNGQQYLEATIASVINQTYDNIEYIIIDGDSNDSTLDLIRKYEDKIDYWISEKDNGIYDAMNKGLSLASGEWVNFLNGGDKYFKHTTIINLLQSNINKYKIVYGDTSLVDSNHNRLRILKTGKLNKKSVKTDMVVCHQSVFVNKDICSLYDISYKYAADYKWIINCIKNIEDSEIKYIKIPIVDYVLGGFSNRNIKQAFIETHKIIYKEFGIFYILKKLPFDLRLLLGTMLRKIFKVQTLRFWLRD